MPFGYECRSRIFKQVPAQPTIRTRPISKELPTPGPNEYEQPQLCGGNGYSKIKRAPAYTFGRVLNPYFPPSVKLNAPMLDVCGVNAKLDSDRMVVATQGALMTPTTASGTTQPSPQITGPHKVPGGLMTPPNWPPGDKLKVPGPGAHDPLFKIRIKRAPAYSLRLAAKPPYQPYDMWTPPPNMYCPPIPKKTEPAYTFPYPHRIKAPFNTPGPGTHEPNAKYVQKTKPAYSLAPGHRPFAGVLKTPAPNTYCEKKFMVGKPSIPAPSFGIKHTPYLGKPGIHTKPPGLELQLSRI